MKHIKTERMRLHPLNLSQLKIYAESPERLAENMGLNPFPLKVDPEFWEHVPDAIGKICIPKVMGNRETYEWWTHWVMELTSEKRLVGGIGLSGLPDEKNEVMVGYYVDDGFSKKGLATEATKAMVDWAFENDNVHAIIADTLLDGIASQKVLEKSGFKKEGKTEEGNLRWRRIK